MYSLVLDNQSYSISRKAITLKVLMAYPRVYPKGATIYIPERCWNGYTVFQAREVGSLLIDMNGAKVRLGNAFTAFPANSFREAT
jgi:hypothetical protein